MLPFRGPGSYGIVRGYPSSFHLLRTSSTCSSRGTSSAKTVPRCKAEKSPRMRAGARQITWGTTGMTAPFCRSAVFSVVLTSFGGFCPSLACGLRRKKGDQRRRESIRSFALSFQSFFFLGQQESLKRVGMFPRELSGLSPFGRGELLFSTFRPLALFASLGPCACFIAAANVSGSIGFCFKRVGFWLSVPGLPPLLFQGRGNSWKPI